MNRRLGLILVCLLLPFLITRDAPADIGRSGGIVILPCAIAVSNCGMTLREQHTHELGADIVFGVPSNLGPNIAVLVQFSGTDTIVSGQVNGGMLIVRASEIAHARATGISSFRILLVDSQQRGVLIEVVLGDGSVTTNIW